MNLYAELLIFLDDLNSKGIWIKDFPVSKNYHKLQNYFCLCIVQVLFYLDCVFQAYWLTQGIITTFQNNILLLCTFCKLVCADL